jgi:asparagine synthase (glutamine-hydrolysing)
MCGILGQIKLQNGIIRDTNKFTRSLNLMAHRGPDGEGSIIGDDYIFGHRRLSIIDLSSNGTQPMVSEDGKVIITFNGEIYNFEELKNDLLKKGYHFKSTTDTEVLLNGYHYYGINFIKKCIGMFAFGIYDKRNGEAYIVRDRLGIKPLFYTKVNKRLTFSSEIKSILDFENIEKTINNSAISSYLSFRYPILDDTFFKEIVSIPPANYLHIKNGSAKLKEYWNPIGHYKKQEYDLGEDYYIHTLRELLASSVSYRMISDVPIGSYLSGGLDSSIVTSIMANKMKMPVKTFNIGYEEEGYNEFHYSRMLSDLYNTEHYELKGNSETYINDMVKLIGYKDSPLSIPNEVSLYNLSSELKKHITVALCGTGADELFHGYGRIFRAPYDYKRKKDTTFFDNRNNSEIYHNNFQKKYGNSEFNTEAEHFYSIYNYTNIKLKKELLSESLDLESHEQNYFNKINQIFDSVETNKYQDKMCQAFIKIHLPGILHHDDCAAMASSVELRVPFLDHRIVEFALSIPNKYKLKWRSEANKIKADTLISDDISEVHDIPKHILKQSYRDEIPKEILNRNKLGFAIPIQHWMGVEFSDYVKDILLSKRAKERGIYNNKSLEILLNNHGHKGIHSDKRNLGDARTYQYSIGSKIWMILNIELFMRQYFD